MKKNMTVLAALFCGAASVALADTASYTFGNGTLSTENDVLSVSSTLVQEDTNSALGTDNVSWQDYSGSYITLASDFPLEVASGAFIPNINVGNGYDWKLTFTLTNNSQAKVTVTGLTFDAFSCTTGGASQATTNKDTIFYVTASTTASASYTGEQNTDIPGSTDFVHPAFDMTTSALELGAGETVTLSIWAGRDPETSTGGAIIGLTNLGVSYTPVSVPEPATATLSLLALAGLCARRRRK